MKILEGEKFFEFGVKNMVKIEMSSSDGDMTTTLNLTFEEAKNLVKRIKEIIGE